MSSVLSQIKQVPVTGGKFVCISGGSYLYDVSSTASTFGRVPVTSGVSSTGATTGEEFIDLGVTFVDRPAANSTMSTVYRKVVKVADAVSGAPPTARFIRTVNPSGTVRFARTA